MSDISPAWRSEIHGILPHRSGRQVLLLPGAAGWSLPRCSVDEKSSGSRVRGVIEAIRLTIGVDVTVLRYAARSLLKDSRQVDAVCVLESRNPAWVPPEGATWVGSAELADLPLVHPHQRTLIASYLADAESRVTPALRPPWARVGWFEEAAAWTESELSRLGFETIGPVEQFKNVGISCILRAQTTSGDVFFKVASSLPLFANEPRLTRGLSALYPDHVPAPLSIDESRRWMLLADFGTAIGHDAPADVHEEVLRHFGQIQLDSASRVDYLLVMGCLDRRLGRLAEQVGPLLEDPMLADLLDADELEQLRSSRPRLEARCAELAAYSLPQTLVHGDLHLENVARPTDTLLFFDWTDACIAHPFFDTISIFYVGDPGARARLLDSYLCLWRRYEPMERLLEAWAIAEPLVALHQAVSYQHIVSALEATSKHEVIGGLAFWLREVLRALE